MPTNDSITPRPSHRTRNLLGQTFNRLTVIRFSHWNKTQQSYWECLCECGDTKVIAGRHITSGKTRSCGCLGKETSIQNGYKTKHGDARTAEYMAYYKARYRCIYPQSQSYKDYGERGIEFRFNSYEEFIEHIGKRPSAKYSLERIDNDGHYEIGNVEWAMRSPQQRNKRTNTILIAFGESHTQIEWSERYGVSASNIHTRLQRGWCAECAISILAHQGTCPHKHQVP